MERKFDSLMTQTLEEEEEAYIITYVHVPNTQTHTQARTHTNTHRAAGADGERKSEKTSYDGGRAFS